MNEASVQGHSGLEFTTVTARRHQAETHSGEPPATAAPSSSRGVDQHVQSRSGTIEVQGRGVHLDAARSEGLDLVAPHV
jgi:hypothetical protein